MSEADKKPDQRDYDIVVNGTRAVVDNANVSYEQVVKIAFPAPEPGVTYSVAYRDADGPHGGAGMLVPGESVKVKKEGTSFNVTPTTRS
ncbi:MAG: multiubiquitin domain-containing protein [Isosphaeraceae bacterium]